MNSALLLLKNWPTPTYFTRQARGKGVGESTRALRGRRSHHAPGGLTNLSSYLRQAEQTLVTEPRQPPLPLPLPPCPCVSLILQSSYTTSYSLHTFAIHFAGSPWIGRYISTCAARARSRVSLQPQASPGSSTTPIVSIVQIQATSTKGLYPYPAREHPTKGKHQYPRGRPAIVHIRTVQRFVHRGLALQTASLMARCLSPIPMLASRSPAVL